VSIARFGLPSCDGWRVTKYHDALARVSRCVTLNAIVTRDLAPKPEPSEDEHEPSGSDRKERVIHTRVPALLEQELKRMAQSLRVPVSNVVRAILEDAVDAVDRVGRKAEGEVRGLAERLAHNRDRLRGMALGRTGDDAKRKALRPNGEPPGRAQPDPSHTPASAPALGRSMLDGIIGVQPLELTMAAQCAVCGRALRAGEKAFVGVRAGDGPPVLIGGECLPTRKRQRSKERKS
jgi:hypothetical protein